MPLPHRWRPHPWAACPDLQARQAPKSSWWGVPVQYSDPAAEARPGPARRGTRHDGGRCCLCGRRPATGALQALFRGPATTTRKGIRRPVRPRWRAWRPCMRVRTAGETCRGVDLLQIVLGRIKGDPGPDSIRRARRRRRPAPRRPPAPKAPRTLAAGRHGPRPGAGCEWSGPAGCRRSRRCPTARW